MIEKRIVTAAQAAWLTGLTPRRLQQLVAEGWIKKPDGHYTDIDTAQGYAAFLKDDNRRGSQAAGKNRANDARAREIELRIAQKEREVIRLDEVVPAIDLLLGEVRSAHDGFPARFTRDRDLRERLEEGMNEILQQLTDRCRQTAAGLRSGRSSPGANAEDDTRRVGGKKPDVPGKRRRSRKKKPQAHAV